jgi:DNA-binding LacI/PurR family transcriptional regulator
MPAAWNLADKSQRITQSILTRIRKSGLDEKYALQVTKRLADAVYGPMLYCVLEESMRTALARGDATAWVAADDYIALYAVLPFLQSRRIRVPRDLSVAGFNNQFESGYTGLSSYHFDIAGMAMRMLTFLLHPALDRRLRPGKYAPLHEGISGFIVERGSMGSLTTAQ